MMSDDFSPPPGVPAEQIVVSPLAQTPLPTTQPIGVSTNKIEIGDSNSTVVQNAEAGLITKTADSVKFDNRMAERKQKLEEAKFKLEEKQALHNMKIELQRENFAEQQEQLERDSLAGAPGEHWIQSYWRPAMGWLYMMICLMDFIIFPTVAMIMPVIYRSIGYAGATYAPWQSLTLQNGGIIHLAFGAILGVSALTRGWEKQATSTLGKAVATK
jgi:hypothetical protein